MMGLLLLVPYAGASISTASVSVSPGALLLSAGGGAILAALINMITNRRKLSADAASVLSKAAAELIQPLRERIQELEQDIDRLRGKTQRLEHDLDTCRAAGAHKDRLIAQLRAGGAPTITTSPKRAT